MKASGAPSSYDVPLNTVVSGVLTEAGAEAFNNVYIYPTAKAGQIRRMRIWHLLEVFGGCLEEGCEWIFIDNELRKQYET